MQVQPFMGAALTELRRQKHKGLRALVLSSNDITEAGQVASRRKKERKKGKKGREKKEEKKRT